MFQVKAQTIKAEIKINQERMEAKIEAARREFQTRLKEVKAGAEWGRRIETGASPVKPPNFDGTTS
jgi:hypothetical protein